VLKLAPNFTPIFTPIPYRGRDRGPFGVVKSRVAAVFHVRLFSDMESEGFSGIFQDISGYISLFQLCFSGATNRPAAP